MTKSASRSRHLIDPEIIAGNAALAAQHGFCCVSVDYRLAPEHVQPSQLQDCYSGLKWCIDHPEELGIDIHKVAVGGSSAGAGLLRDWRCSFVTGRNLPSII